MNKNYIIIRPTGSLCNRLRVILSYKHEYPDKLIKVLWLMYDKAVGCKFEDYFEPIANIEFYDDKYWSEFTKIGIDYIGCYIINNNFITTVADILKPNKYIEDKIDLFLKDITTFKSIHIRRTDLWNQKSKLGVTSDEEFESFIKEHSDVKIFLATDNSETQTYFSKKYKNIFFYDEIKTNYWDYKLPRNTSMEIAIIDLFICSKSNEFLGTTHSSYSDLIYWLRS